MEDGEHGRDEEQRRHRATKGGILLAAFVQRKCHQHADDHGKAQASRAKLRSEMLVTVAIPIHMVAPDSADDVWSQS